MLEGLKANATVLEYFAEQYVQFMSHVFTVKSVLIACMNFKFAPKMTFWKCKSCKAFYIRILLPLTSCRFCFSLLCKQSHSAVWESAEVVSLDPENLTAYHQPLSVNRIVDSNNMFQCWANVGTATGMMGRH